MKLLTRYNRTNIISAVIILLVTSISFYFIIRTILIKQLDKDLKVEEQEIFAYITENNSLPNAAAYKGQEIKFEAAGSGAVRREIKTMIIPNRVHHEDVPARVLTFPIKLNGALFRAIVIKSQVEAEDLLAVIVLVTGGIILLMLVIISLINRFLLNKIWQPFYSTLKQLRTFDIKNVKALDLPGTKLEEFNELNTAVSIMTKRIHEEFETLKAFSDNASHEMQTPLAIINSKLDMLLQTCNEVQAEQLQAIYTATGRLTRLNQTLLLLTKINNDQFSDQRRIDLKKLLQQKMQQFEELIKARDLTVYCEAEEASININEELAEIMMNNLLSNAIKHNVANGYIRCLLTNKEFTILNSGVALTFEPRYIFQRFQKGRESAGTGLGLAVVQQICENTGLSIQYNCNDTEHVFTITF